MVLTTTIARSTNLRPLSRQGYRSQVHRRGLSQEFSVTVAAWFLGCVDEELEVSSSLVHSPPFFHVAKRECKMDSTYRWHVGKHFTHRATISTIPGNQVSQSGIGSGPIDPSDPKFSSQPYSTLDTPAIELTLR